MQENTMVKIQLSIYTVEFFSVLLHTFIICYHYSKLSAIVHHAVHNLCQIQRYQINYQLRTVTCSYMINAGSKTPL